MLLREFNEELVWLVADEGFKDKFRGVSPPDSEKLLLNEGIEIPDGLPFVGGNFITSTLSVDVFGETLASWS